MISSDQTQAMPTAGSPRPAEAGKQGSCLMVQGTSSSAGKSLLVTGLVRLFRQDGFTVAPFKGQNMSLNSYPAVEGGEIGRAQVAQAEAAGLRPSVDMNPVLLKPTTDVGAQVIVHGLPIAQMGAREYHEFKGSLLPAVRESLERLRAAYQVVVIEGAGSPAEINLREHDIVNMAVAHLGDCPVVLVADIDRGGVFASIYGTWALMDEPDRARLAGFVINKFRGDASILEPGIREIERRTGIPCLGVLPFLRDVGIADEDSVSLDDAVEAQRRVPQDAEGWPLGEGPRVAILRLPRVSNFTDFESLVASGLFRVRYVDHPSELEQADLVILPGTKSTMADLAEIRDRGFDSAFAQLRERKARVLGVCGGYQMLGERILDPEGVEGTEAEIEGLGLLAVTTTFAAAKVTEPAVAEGVEGSWFPPSAQTMAYEIHMGRTEGSERPLFRLRPLSADSGGFRAEGAVSADGLIAGTYAHGLFDDFSTVASLARLLGVPQKRIESAGERLGSDHARREAAYDRLADSLRANLDWARIRQLAGVGAEGEQS